MAALHARTHCALGPCRTVALFVVMVAQLAALPPGCAAPVPRPLGVPETPYWFVVGDSAFWYEPADSLALVQFAEGAGEAEVEQRLYDLRELGWRLTPERGPALRWPTQEQNLAQQLLQVEKVAKAISPVDGWRTFERRFWPGRIDRSEPLLGILPGLRPFGGPNTKYYWPNCISIAWGDSLTALEAERWLKDQGCRVLTSPQLIFPYYVQRIWVVEIPGGALLFDWLQRLNGDPRIETAYPVSALREPPASDPRDAGLNLLAGSPGPGSAGRPDNCAKALWEAYRIAHFAGLTMPVSRATSVQVEGDLFKVVVMTREDAPVDDSAFVVKFGGRVISRSMESLVVWVPYAVLPALAADERVRKIEPAAR